MIKGLLFDLGGVVVFNHLDKQLENFAKKLKIDVERVKESENVEHDKLVLGKLSIKEFCSSIRNRFELEQDSPTLLLIWEEVYQETTQLNRELIDVIGDLRKKYQVGLISNIFDVTASFHQRQRLLAYFKPVILSCRVGLAKPDTDIFERAIKDMHLKGEEILYIDDSENHLEVARSLGMKTILFKDNKQLLKEFKKLKIKG